MNNEVAVCDICNEYTAEWFEIKEKYIITTSQGRFVRKKKFVICGECELCLKDLIRDKRISELKGE